MDFSAPALPCSYEGTWGYSGCVRFAARSDSAGFSFRIFFFGLCSIGFHHYVLLLSLSDNFTHLLFHVSYRSCPSSSELECGHGKKRFCDNCCWSDFWSWEILVRRVVTDFLFRSRTSVTYSSCIRFQPLLQWEWNLSGNSCEKMLARRLVPWYTGWEPSVWSSVYVLFWFRMTVMFIGGRLVDTQPISPWGGAPNLSPIHLWSNLGCICENVQHSSVIISCKV